MFLRVPLLLFANASSRNSSPRFKMYFDGQWPTPEIINFCGMFVNRPNKNIMVIHKSWIFFYFFFSIHRTRLFSSSGTLACIYTHLHFSRVQSLHLWHPLYLNHQSLSWWIATGTSHAVDRLNLNPSSTMKIPVFN